MKKILLQFVFFIMAFNAAGQAQFQVPDGVDKVEIPFETAYNLIVVPAIVNGVELKMILDTGASGSIIFNFANIDSLSMQTGNLLKLSGYGENTFFSAYYSQNNIIDINGYKNESANIFVASEKEVFLEPILGLPINGLLGADFFRDAIVKIDYINQLITVYPDNQKIRRKTRSMSQIPLVFQDGKPYIYSKIYNNNNFLETKLLIDTGSGDALWLNDIEREFEVNNKNFEDHLGVGLNGDIYGRRSKLKHLVINKFTLDKVTVSLPENKMRSTKEKKETNAGSIGGEILRRFNVVLDYKNYMLYLEPNKELSDGFFYNMAGLKIMAGKKELFTDIVYNSNNKANVYGQEVEASPNLYASKTFNYKMVPELIVKYVRPNSPAALAGVMEGDEIIKIDSKEKGSLTVGDLISRFHKKPFSSIKLKVKRGDKTLKFKFQLIPLI